MSAIVSQSIITRLIIGCWMFKQHKTAIVSRVNPNPNDTYVLYRVNCYGYKILLTVWDSGKVFAELRAFGRIACTASTLAGFISLLKNCKRWASETQPANNTEGK